MKIESFEDAKSYLKKECYVNSFKKNNGKIVVGIIYPEHLYKDDKIIVFDEKDELINYANMIKESDDSFIDTFSKG